MLRQQNEGGAVSRGSNADLKRELEFVSMELQSLGYSSQLQALEMLPTDEAFGVLEYILLLVSEKKVSLSCRGK